MNSEIVDARGMACPMPVVHKKSWRQSGKEL